jgi:hypothetical protein
VSEKEPEPAAAGTEWFAAALAEVLARARASELDAGLAGDLAGVRDLALLMGDWAQHQAAGAAFFTVTLSLRRDGEDRVTERAFTLPHDPDAAEFLGRLARQLALLAGQRARDPVVIGALTELTGLAAGLFKALTESLDTPGGAAI